MTMTHGDEPAALAQGDGKAPTPGLPLLAALRSKSPAFKAGLALGALAVVGLGVLGIAMAAHRAPAPATAAASGQGTDYVAGFEAMCVPGTTQKYAAVGFDSSQATAKATQYCHCVATKVADTLTPEILATAQRTKTMPASLKTAIGKAVVSCQ